MQVRDIRGTDLKKGGHMGPPLRYFLCAFVPSAFVSVLWLLHALAGGDVDHHDRTLAEGVGILVGIVFDERAVPEENAFAIVVVLDESRPCIAYLSYSTGTSTRAPSSSVRYRAGSPGTSIPWPCAGRL